jgi:hypothetical protein
MKRPLLLLLSLCIVGSPLWAQSNSTNYKVEFEFKLPELRKKDSARRISRVSNSLYDNIDFLDSRPRPVIGPTFTGLLKNKPADLVLKQPVGAQFTGILNGLIDGTAGNGSLLFQLQRFYYIEEFTTHYCYLQATLYSKTGTQYRKLLTLDTSFVIQYNNVVDYLDAVARPLVCVFIRDALKLPSTDSAAYDLSALNKMDSIERARLPLFTDTAWVDGLYLSYRSFSQQLPDRQCTVKMTKDGQIKWVKVLDAEGNAAEQKWKNMYALVYRGQAYMATEYGLYPVTRTDNALLFTGDIRIPPTSGEMNTSAFMLGLTGMFITSRGYRTTYTMAIDQFNGQFLHLRVIPQTPVN